MELANSYLALTYSLLIHSIEVNIDNIKKVDRKRTDI